MTGGIECKSCPSTGQALLVTVLTIIIAVILLFGVYWLVLRVDHDLIEHIKVSGDTVCMTAGVVALRRCDDM